MHILSHRKAVVTLLLLLISTLSTSSLIPYMGVYIVDGLGKSPLSITMYAMIVLPLTLLANRSFGERIDRGHRIAPLLFTSLFAYVIGVSAILMFHSYTMLLLITAPCMALANAAVSTMYTFGRLRAQDEGWDVTRYNSFLRATTSLGWMIAPALAFFVAGAFGTDWVFRVALIFAALWGLGLLIAMPKGFSGPQVDKSDDHAGGDLRKALWLAVGVCFLTSLGHALAASSIPLFVIQEIGLPVSSPGLMLSVKTAFEIIVILMTPLLLRRLGAHLSLCVAAGLAIATYLILTQVSSVPQLLLTGALDGTYYGIFAAVGLIYVQGFAAGRLGRATALYMNSLFLGGLVASPMMGLIAQLTSFRTNIFVACVFSGLALVLLGFIRMREIRLGRASSPFEG